MLCSFPHSFYGANIAKSTKRFARIWWFRKRQEMRDRPENRQALDEIRKKVEDKLKRCVVLIGYW